MLEPLVALGVSWLWIGLEGENSEYGLIARVMGPIAGSFILAAMFRERRRLRKGQTSEPPTFYEVSRAAATEERGAAACRWVAAVAPEMPSTGDLAAQS